MINANIQDDNDDNWYGHDEHYHDNDDPNHDDDDGNDDNWDDPPLCRAGGATLDSPGANFV